MSLKDWFTKNIYVTSPGNTDPFYHPRIYSMSREEVVKHLHEIATSLKGWKIEEYRQNQGLLRISRSSLFPPSAQDINIYVVQKLDGTTKLEATSNSRGGKGDFGQNKRNIKELLLRLDSQLKPSGG